MRPGPNSQQLDQQHPTALQGLTILGSDFIKLGLNPVKELISCLKLVFALIDCFGAILYQLLIAG